MKTRRWFAGAGFLAFVTALVVILTGCAGYVDDGYDDGGAVYVGPPEPDYYMFGGGYYGGHYAHAYGHRGFHSRQAAHFGGHGGFHGHGGFGGHGGHGR